MTKICNRCKTVKPLTDFFNDKNNKTDGKYSICKVCKQEGTYKWRKTNPDKYNKYAGRWRAKNPDKQHATDIKRLYGLKIDQYNVMLAKQGCKCKVCGKQHDPTVKRGRLYVDHAKSGKIRGLLCSACNCALGYVKDNEDTLMGLINYLRINKE